MVYAPTVGLGRDTILNLLPNERTQNDFTKMLAVAFGSGFKLWNSQKKEIPFHVTIAQTNKLNAILSATNANTKELEQVSALSF